MSVVTYAAHDRAPLISGHTAGVSYSFEMPFMAYEESYNSPNTQHRSLDGTVETVLKRIDDSINITIGLYDSVDIPQIKEFIKSVAGGETFTVDVDGTIATPDTPISVKLNGNSVSPTRAGPRTYSLAFKLFVV